jgi:hypothetical protein
VRPGDELRVECEVIEVRPSKLPEQGLIKLRTRRTEQSRTNDGVTEVARLTVGIATQEWLDQKWLDQIEISIPSQDQPKISEGLSPKNYNPGNFPSIGSGHDAGKKWLGRIGQPVVANAALSEAVGRSYRPGISIFVKL